MTAPLSFAATLKQLREGRGWSLGDLAAVSGLDRGYLWKLEAGRSEPSWTTVQKLAVALSVSTEVFRH